MQQEENVQLNETQLAYRTIGQALWNTLCRAKSMQAEAPECLNRLMDALAESEEKGSVCVQWSNKQKADLTTKQCEELKGYKLLTEKPEKLEQNGNQEIPFVLDRQSSVTRVYTQRRFMQEREVALSILAMSQKKIVALKAPVKKALLGFNELLYGPAREYDEESLAEQQRAVAEALKHQFFIITGGPGTGKTTVVAKLLECLLIENPTLKIALAAPTGKATARIMQSLINSTQRFPDHFSHVIERINADSLPARTIHKWLLSPNEKGKIPNAEHPLDVDVMIIDEASMIDLRLAKRLLSVIDENRTRLILLGDKYQLSAVGPGSVLGDLTAKDGAMAKNVAELTISHRFTSDSNVGLLASEIKTAEKPFDIKGFIDEFKSRGEGKDQVSIKLYHTNNFVDRSLRTWMKPHLGNYLKALKTYQKKKDAPSLQALWLEAERFRVLCATRVGSNGVNAINDYAEALVREEVGAPSDALFYPGRLVIIRKNTPSLDVYNGDVGIVIEQAGDSSRYELFIGDRDKRIPAGLLPEHDTAFAMTIHQSQGSQFEHVAVLLPGDAESPLCSRELFYTGVTRAQKEAAVFGSLTSIERSVLTRTERASGLADRLAGK